MKNRIMTSEEHGELCVYLDEWLNVFYKMYFSLKNKRDFDQEYAKVVSSTLSDLLSDDAIEAGL